MMLLHSKHKDRLQQCKHRQGFLLGEQQLTLPLLGMNQE
jgi:hypothetical protein